MPFCRSCGSELSNETAFCPKCGAAVAPPNPSYSSPPSPVSETEVDRLLKDSKTQDFWFRRAVAYVIDWIIVVIVSAIIGLIIFPFAAFSGIFFPFSFVGAGFALLAGLLYLLYFTLADYKYQRTVGKNVMGLQVITTDGSRLDIGKAFIRNLSKIHPVLLILDLIGGFFMKVKPGQKFSDSIANTTVTSFRKSV
jgi:uncharacterized RDD family membrane protein YckC